MKIIEHQLIMEEGRPVPFVPSPNKGGSFSPAFVVIHYTGGGSASSAVRTLTSPARKASAHLVIGREGDLTQLVRFDERAWHALLGLPLTEGLDLLANRALHFLVRNRTRGACLDLLAASTGHSHDGILATLQTDQHFTLVLLRQLVEPLDDFGCFVAHDRHLVPLILRHFAALRSRFFRGPAAPRQACPRDE